MQAERGKQATNVGVWILRFVAGRNIVYNQVNKPAERSTVPLVDSRPQGIRTQRWYEDVGITGRKMDWATIFGALRGSPLEVLRNNTGSNAFSAPRQPQDHTILLCQIGVLQVM